MILDASVALAWLLVESDRPLTANARRRLGEGVTWVPPIWDLETRNGILMAERRRRIGARQRRAALEALRAMPVLRDRRADLDETVNLARRHRLTVYDALYLELAQRSGNLLATLDGALHRAARAEGIPVLEGGRPG